MFIFIIQLIDFIAIGTVALFLVFYVLSWITLTVRLVMSARYKKPKHRIGRDARAFTVVLPVFNEEHDRFQMCLDALLQAVESAVSTPANYEVIVVENGSKKHEEATLEHGFTYEHIDIASKRRAIAHGMQKAKYPYTILLDSDTICTPESIMTLLSNFDDPSVGGVVPYQEVIARNTNIMTRLCDWYEDIRFGNTTPGLSRTGAVPCLIGRLYAVRTDPVREYMPDFVSQWVLGERMETGDDRVITSALLQAGYKTVYDSRAKVMTFAPTDLRGFVKQRTRWSRSSFRETVLSLPWLWKHPYAFFVMWSDIVMRWLFAAVVLTFSIQLATGTLSPHLLAIPMWVYVVGGVVGFFISGWLKQIPHLMRRPEDFWYTPLFLLLTTFVLTPVEWYGNLTCTKQGWLTRK